MTKKAYVILPRSQKFDDIFDKEILPALKEFGIGYYLDKNCHSNISVKNSFHQRIHESDIIIADLTDFDEDFLYKLGFANALNKVNIYMMQNASNKKFPEVLNFYLYHRYELDSLFKDNLIYKIVVRDLNEIFYPDLPFGPTENSILKFYFSYKDLPIFEVENFFRNLLSIHNKLMSLSSPVYYIPDYERAYRNTILLSDVYTGNSVNISLKEGWIPEFKIIDGDIDIRVPKKIGIPAIIGFLLLNAAKYSLDIHNSYLDAQLKGIEYQTKQIEYMEKVKSKDLAVLKRMSNKTIKDLELSNYIEKFEINNISILANDKN